MNYTTPSPIPSLISAFEADNEAHLAPTERLLERVLTDKMLHVRFMNTLSLMEHMGSHKISATQTGDALTQETLKHLAEEARHAFFFKRNAERFAGRTLAYSAADMLAPASARMYFQRLEAAVKKGSDASGPAVYLTTSMVIEFRAAWAYQLYQAALERLKVRMSLKSLLAEEKGHLGDMAGRLMSLGAFSEEATRRFCREETRLYGRLLTSLDAALGSQAAA